MSSWAVVLPVKRWATAKSRLTADPDLRAELARAFTLDVLATSRSTPGVSRVMVVTREPMLPVLLSGLSPMQTAAGELAEVVVLDDSGRSLNESILQGAGEAVRRWPGQGTAVVASDLPALRPEHLAAVLEAAAAHDRSAVADTEGTGTTVLTARSGYDVRPAFGAGSFARHRQLGAADLTSVAAPGARRDVDVARQLITARRLGVGAHTQVVCDG